MTNELDFRDSETSYHGYLASILGAIKLVGYDAVRTASLEALGEVPGITTERLTAFQFASLQPLNTEDDVLLFLNFVLFGDWQSRGIPVVGVLTSAERLGIIQIVHGVCNGLLTTEINRITSLTPSMPEDWDVPPAPPESEPE